MLRPGERVDDVSRLTLSILRPMSAAVEHPTRHRAHAKAPRAPPPTSTFAEARATRLAHWRHNPLEGMLRAGKGELPRRPATAWPALESRGSLPSVAMARRAARPPPFVEPSSASTKAIIHNAWSRERSYDPSLAATWRVDTPGRIRGRRIARPWRHD